MIPKDLIQPGLLIPSVRVQRAVSIQHKDCATQQMSLDGNLDRLKLVIKNKSFARKRSSEDLFSCRNREAFLTEQPDITVSIKIF